MNRPEPTVPRAPAGRLRRLENEAEAEIVGSKAFNLGRLIRAGLPVPEGWVIGTDWFAQAGRFQRALPTSSDRAPDASEPLPAPLLAELAALPDVRYAVRSSGQLEDLAELSFAGQYETVLDVARDDLADAVKACLASVDAASATAYRQRHGLSDGGMAVVVQRLVRSEFSGVAFTLDPVTGADTQLVIEYAPGLGEALVGGQVVPTTVRYDWYDERWLGTPPQQAWLGELAGLCVAAQQEFGYPLDIEFAYADGKVWLLQARAVTKITHTGLDDVWSTADFKDGGVSAETCKPYMWSLYEYVWEHSLRDFLLTPRLIEPRRLRKLGRMFYGRPYWNLSVVKEVMARVPGYRERDFDEEFGIQPTYTGDGQVTRMTPMSLARLAPVALAQSRLLARREAEAASLAHALRDTVDQRLRELRKHEDSADDWIERAFVTVTRDDYLTSESAYFWQIFLNTVHQSLFKDSVRIYVDDEGYLALLSGLDDISHLRPFQDLWRISHEPGAPDAHAALAAHLAAFGYHSDKELDVSYPNYWEQPSLVETQLADVAALDASHDPALVVARQRTVFQTQLGRLAAILPGRRYTKLKHKVLRMRRLLWWREEFRDVSTRMYDVIRRYTMALASAYVARGVLDDPDDIWFVRVGDLWRFIDGETPELRSFVARNRRYYNAYRDYRSENEITPTTTGRNPDQRSGIGGIGCSPGRVTGRARVVDGIGQIGRIQEGDILVTRFTDTGWTAKFALLRGVVTEYGGMLCHAAIVSREYGIPCVVGVTGLLDAIRDGQEIAIDGGAGTVTVVS